MWFAEDQFPTTLSLKESNSMDIYSQYLLDNKYARWYINIIETRRNRILENTIYTEKHHIIPKSIGGTDLDTNLVVLTYKEHFLCHWILCKAIKKEYKRKAFSALSAMRRNKNQVIHKSSWMFDVMKRAVKEAMIGREIHQETIEKNRSIALALHQDPDYIKKYKDGMAAAPKKPATDKQRKAASITITAYNKTEKHREDVRRAQTGRKKSEEQKRKQSETMKNGAAAFGERNAMADPIHRKKVADSKIGLKAMRKDGILKLARPNTDKWNLLLEQGFLPATDLIG
jgi:hypothetical protein